MTPRYIFHVGYHKTGTTYLQRRLFPCLPVAYANDRRLTTALRDSETDYLSIIRNHKEAFTNQSESVFLISGERFSGSALASDGETFDIPERIRAMGVAAKALIVVREQYSYITSYFAHRTKKAYCTSMTQFLERHGDSLSEKLQYHRLVEAYQEALGPEGVLVLPYEMMKHNLSAFLSSILEFMKIDYSGGPIDASAVNPSRASKRWIQFNLWMNRILMFPTKHGMLAGRFSGRYEKAYERFKLSVVDRYFQKAFWWDSSVVSVPTAYKDRTVDAFSASNRELSKNCPKLELDKYGYC